MQPSPHYTPPTPCATPPARAAGPVGSLAVFGHAKGCLRLGGSGREAAPPPENTATAPAGKGRGGTEERRFAESPERQMKAMCALGRRVFPEADVVHDVVPPPI
ncbi:hypothetical protein [Streptomyces sp. NPDC059071]|uniref:hypothetical protein n=1 Tax=unclassified Streptomyces TaxID=2593676 RepID=UPI00364CC2A6